MASKNKYQFIPWSSSRPSPTSRAKKSFEEKISPFQWTGRWKFVTNGGSWQHFYRRLNASKSARIESREDSKTHSVAKIGKNGVFFVKRARCNPRFSHLGCLWFIRGWVVASPNGRISNYNARVLQKNTIFPDFGDAMSLRIFSTFDSRAFRRI